MDMDRKEIIWGVISLLLLVGLLWYGGKQAAAPNVDEASIASLSQYFTSEVRLTVNEEVGQPIEGYEPFMIMQTYRGISSADFQNVEAVQGTYASQNGDVVFELNVPLNEQHSAARAITDGGMETLLRNIADRLDIKIRTNADVDRLLRIVAQVPASPSDDSEDEDNPIGGGWGNVACTMDAKICPDGSAVGRVPPSCQFAACPLVRSCPDEWIENRMPGPISNEPKEYYIVDGERRELSDYDNAWVRANCDLEKQVVY